MAPDQREATAQALAAYGERHKLHLTNEIIEALLQGNVLLSLSARVYSERLGEWRRSQPQALITDDFVAGNEIGLLRNPVAVGDLNLGPKATRQQCTVEAEVLTREVALPFFDQFRRPEELVQSLLERDLPGFSVTHAFEYVLCFGGRQRALDLLDRHLDAESGRRSRFADFLPQFQTEEWRALAAKQKAEGIPIYGHQERAGELAKIAATYQLALNT